MPKIFTGIYDLQTSPFAFDFITFLAISNAHRHDLGCDGLHVVIIPGKGHGFEAADFRKYHEHQFPIEHAQWRFMNIFMPALGLTPNLHGLTVCVSRDHGRQVVKDIDRDLIFPKGYDIENPPEVYWTDRELATLANLGYEVPGFEAPAEALGFIDRWIEMNAGGRKVVPMTLREGLHGEVKNSNIEAWVEFARSLDPKIYYPVFVPDMVRSFDGPRPDLGGFPVFTDPTSNLMIRTALYERAYISLFTGSGPCSICFHSGAIRYLIFKTHPPYHKGPVPWAVLMGLDPDDKLIRTATPYQKRIDEEETFELLTQEFDAMAALIEADPEKAFRRHRLKRTDVGLRLAERVSQYMAMEVGAQYASEFCQRYTERFPEQIDQAINLLATTDIITMHAVEPVLRRSIDLYDRWLAGKDRLASEHAMVAWARVKIDATLGNTAQLEELIRSAPALDKAVQRGGVLQGGLIQMAVIYFKKGLMEEAIYLATSVNEIYPDANSAMFLAMMLEGAGRLDEAKARLLKLVADGITAPAIYESLSRISRAMGDVNQSIEYLILSRGVRST